ncbi:diacylglycerol kinase [Alkalihalophilus pseudofirmus]|uniref:diacylglycerol kinase n=1 Tax=Alkalihalobacterium alkalinitrilicum TaxID=427920 RepID=UPI00094DB25A|nr:diacylglycerol kinase family protein [Alkalihalobacterium alkalinitrilicum]OLO38892.1 diacylglycerol kinase [Alkalihalophilus pseudofirmus]
MDLKDKNLWGFKRLLRSFVYAWTGLKYVIRFEQNMRIHLIVSFIVIVLAFLLEVPLIHKIILLLVIGMVLSLEVMNTAIERTVDMITEDFHPKAKVAKDIAAAAVFIFSIISVLIGLSIFLPPIIERINMVLG